MTVFKATQQVNLSAGGFTTIFGSLHHAFSPVHNGNEFKLENSPSNTVVLDFRSVPGHPFTYFGHVPSGGDIASLQINWGGPPAPLAYKFTSMIVPITTLASDVNSGHYAAALNLLFPGHDTITGSIYGDHLPDFHGHDRITGGLGNDTMSGGAGYDTFVFHAGFGNDVINHFIAGSGANHDTIELDHVAGLPNFHQVRLHEALVAGNVVISDTSGDSITFTNLHKLTSLTAADFHIHA